MDWRMNIDKVAALCLQPAPTNLYLPWNFIADGRHDKLCLMTSCRAVIDVWKVCIDWYGNDVITIKLYMLNLQYICRWNISVQ